MSKYLRIFNNHSAYTTFTGTSEFIKPNVSLCNNENELHYNRLIIPTGVSLNKSSVNLLPNGTETLVATLTPSGAFSDNIVWSSSDETVATVSLAGLVTYVGESGNVTITVTVNGSLTATCNVSSTPSHDYVEIGGIKWATMNVGANSITDTGLYFQWGDTQGYTAAQVGSGEGQKTFEWGDYKFNPSGDGLTFTKYTGEGSSGSGSGSGSGSAIEGDNLCELQLSDDAVNAAWGGNWRMPTIAEFQALGTATTSAWTADYEGSGVAGLVLTSTADSSKKLFFPAAGLAYGGSVFNVGSVGFYWGSSLYSDYVSYAYYLNFYDGNVNWALSDYRSSGYLVRGVIGE